MARRNRPIPNGPPPIQYKTEINEAGEEIQVEIVQDIPPLPSQMPPKNLYGQDLKKLKCYRDLRKNYKMNEIKTQFISDVSQILGSLDPKGENHLDTELLIAIINLAEQFFIYPGKREERDALKLEAIYSLMLPFFDDNTDILNMAMGTVMNRVKKSNVFKRVWARTKLFFRS